MQPPEKVGPAAPVEWQAFGNNYGKEKDGTTWTGVALYPTRPVSAPVKLRLEFSDQLLGEPAILAQFSDPGKPPRALAAATTHQRGNTFIVTISDPVIESARYLFVRAITSNEPVQMTITCIECPAK